MTEYRQNVIAIDGPAGSGKSTTARLAAQKLGFLYLDTGAMYRAVTVKILKNKIDVNNEDEISRLLDDTNIDINQKNGKLRIFIDNIDVTKQIRTQHIANNVASVASHPKVREWMVKLQQKIGNNKNIVAEGRDIGTVVFPNARLKFFLVASIEERARRRSKDFIRNGDSIELQKVILEIEKRDKADSERSVGPLKKAEDAVELDTTDLTIDHQVDCIVDYWKKKSAS